jgi:uncharacterized membrane protein YtjA (UPF0391 family)
MLHYTIIFFILAVVAGILGFGGLAGTFVEIAKFLAILFVVLLVISLVYNLISGKRMSPPPAL